MQPNIMTLLMILALLISLPVKSKEDLFFMSLEDLMNITIISSTGNPISLRKAPSVATVITAKEIKNMGARTLDDILQTVPGVYVSASPGVYLTPTWSIRGIVSDINTEVVLLLNGLPIKDTYMGIRSILFKMGVNMISKVEIVKGPGSAIYGADAFSGTINVITKNSSEIRGTSIGVGYGSFNSSNVWALHGSKYKNIDLAIGIEFQKTSGDNERVIEQDYLGKGSPSYTPTSLDTRHQFLQTNIEAHMNKWTVRLFSNIAHNSGLGPEALQFVGSSRTHDSEKIMLDLQYENKDLFNDVEFEIRAYSTYYHKDEFGYSEPVNLWGGKELHEIQYTLEGIAICTGINNHKFRFATGYTSINLGVDHLYQNYGHASAPEIVDLKGTSNAPLYDQTRNFIFISAQDMWTITKNLELTAGIRHDKYSDFGSTTNPRVALVWPLGSKVTTKLLYGKAFRAPSFTELHMTNSPHIIGNKNLRPEKLENKEISFSYSPYSNLHTSLNIFHYTIKDRIGYVPDGVHTTGKSQNHQTLKGNGGELIVKWQPTLSLRLITDMSYASSKDKSSKERTAMTPEWKYHLEAQYHFPKNLIINGQYYHIGKRTRENGDPRKAMEKYDTFNLTLKKKNIAKHWDMSISIYNIFNENIRMPTQYDSTRPLGAIIPGDYPMEGRSIFVEANYHL